MTLRKKQGIGIGNTRMLLNCYSEYHKLHNRPQEVGFFMNTVSEMQCYEKYIRLSGVAYARS